jgi:hypothetical protein
VSLDVYLTTPGVKHQNASESGIFVRENGAMREISRTEWERLNPGREPITVVPEGETEEVYSANITHNLGRMASASKVYDALWRPDEHGMTHARDLIGPLHAGLQRLRNDPGYFKTFNPENGWGDYDGLVRFVANYLAACEQHPGAEIHVSR